MTGRLLRRLGDLPLRRISAVFLMRVLGAALVYLSQVALARWLGRDDYGVYLSALAWLNLLALPAALGLPVAAVRFVPAYRVAGDWMRVRGFIGRGGVAVLVGGAVAGAAALAGLALAGTEADRLLLLAVALAGVPVLAGLTFVGECLRGFGWVEIGYFPRLLGRSALLLLAASLLWLWRPLTPLDVIAIEVAAMTALLAGSVLILVRRLPVEARTATPTVELRLWITVGLPLILMDGFMTALRDGLVLLVEWQSDAAAVAAFGAAWSTANAALLVSISVHAVMAPRVSELYALGDRARLQAYVSRTNHWQFWPTLASALVLAAAGRPVLSLFGPAFVEAYPVLLVLLVGWVLNASTGSLGMLLLVAGLERPALLIMLAALAAAFAAAWLLVPAFGATGAAMAAVVAIVVRNGWMFVTVRRRIGVAAWVGARVPAAV